MRDFHFPGVRVERRPTTPLRWPRPRDIAPRHQPSAGFPRIRQPLSSISSSTSFTDVCYAKLCICISNVCLFLDVNLRFLFSYDEKHTMTDGLLTFFLYIFNEVSYNHLIQVLKVLSSSLYPCTLPFFIHSPRVYPLANLFILGKILREKIWIMSFIGLFFPTMPWSFAVMRQGEYSTYVYFHIRSRWVGILFPWGNTRRSQRRSPGILYRQRGRYPLSKGTSVFWIITRLILIPENLLHGVSPITLRKSPDVRPRRRVFVWRTFE